MTIDSNTPASKLAAHSTEDDIPADIVAAIAAAVTVFLGTRFRIHSLEMLHSNREPVSRWTRQGRVSIQGSHNPRLRPR